MNTSSFSSLWSVLLALWFLWTASPSGPATHAAEALTYKEVTFLAQDGVRLRGRLYGQGQVAVILSHMYGTDMRIWHDLATELSKRGYKALAYNFRRTGAFQDFAVLSKLHLDVLAAIKFIERKGPKRIYLIGASMGGTASLVAAAQRRVDGVVVISSGIRFYGLNARNSLPVVTAPKLFIVGERDRPFSESVKTMYRLSPNPKELKIYPTAAHGTYLFRTSYGPQIKQAIFAFLSPP